MKGIAVLLATAGRGTEIANDRQSLVPIVTLLPPFGLDRKGRRRWLRHQGAVGHRSTARGATHGRGRGVQKADRQRVREGPARRCSAAGP